MPTYKSYHSYLIESLKDPLEAAAYLACIIHERVKRGKVQIKTD
jgi:hypothetical protein